MEESLNIPTIDFGPVEDKSLRILKVVGVGGGGCNAVRNMYNEGIDGVSFAVCNTDSKVLANSPVPVKLQLGEGLGAGANPEVGRSEAESNEDDIRRLLNDNTKMVFITAGMGGGTGTGAACGKRTRHTDCRHSHDTFLFRKKKENNKGTERRGGVEAVCGCNARGEQREAL